MKYLLGLLFSLVGCGKSETSISTHKHAIKLQLHVVPKEGPAQRPQYDKEKKEGQLYFLLEYQNAGKRSGILLTHVQTAYLYTEYDQSKLEYPFDNQEAYIFLKIPAAKKAGKPQRIKVGRYLPALDFGVLSYPDSGLLPVEYWNSHGRWMSPILCEGASASICRIEVKIQKKRSVFTPDQQVSVLLYLGQEEKPAYRATSKKEVS